jgi:hypothetical protein
MRDLIDEALAQAFKEEVVHVFRNMSRDLDTIHGGHRKAALTLIETIKKLRSFHNEIVGLLDVSHS